MKIRRPIFSKISATVAILVIGLFVVACGPRLEGLTTVNPNFNQLADGTISTGAVKTIKIENGTKTIEVPFTPAGAADEFSRIQQEIGSTSDKLTAKAIESVVVNLYDKNSNATDSHPVRLDLSVVFEQKSEIEPKSLAFAVSLVLSGNTLTGHTESQTTTKANLTFTTDVTCLDLDCREIDIRLNRHLREKSGTLSAALGHVGILYRLTYPTVRLQKSKNPTASNDPDLKDLSLIKEDQKAIRSSVSIVDGHSYSHVVIVDTSTKPGENKPALDIRTDMVDTEVTPSQVESLQIGPSQKPVEAELVGADPDTGDIVIDIKSGARVYIDEVPKKNPPKKTPPKPVEDVSHVRSDTNQLVPFLADEKKSPQALKVTAAFAKHANNDEVQRLVRVWLGQEADRGACRSVANPQKLDALLKYGPQALQLVTPLALNLDVTPEIAYILPIESSYAVDPNRPTTEVAQVDDPKVLVTAVGPWQITDVAAFSLRDNSRIHFSVFPVVNRKPDLRDDRTFFYNSTYMAALLFKEMFAQFDKYPAIAIMAYNGGMGSANYAIRKTAKYEDFDITLEEIQTHRIQTKTNCSYLNYAYTFLALRTIGQNLDAYKVKLDPKLNKNYLNRLRNPKSPLPPGI
jgi:hypothetical protein